MPMSVVKPVMCVERTTPLERMVITVLCMPMMKHSVITVGDHSK